MAQQQLSPRQAQRLQNFEDIFADRREKGFLAKVIIVRLKDTIIMPMIALLLWGITYGVMQYLHVDFPYWLLLGPALILGVILRELLRGLAYAMASRHGFSDLCFHMTWRRLLFKCDLVMPISQKGYAWGNLCPWLLLGLVPILLGVFYKNHLFLAYGIFMLIACLSDLLVFFKVMRFKSSAARVDVIDHPVRSGYVFFEK